MTIFWDTNAKTYDENRIYPLNYLVDTTNSPNVFYIGNPIIVSGNEGYCKCGIMDTSNKNKTCEIVLWRHTRINSVKVKSSLEEPMYYGLPKRTSYTYTVNIDILPQGSNSNDKINHSFVFKDNVVNFISLILNTINIYIENGYDINKLDLQVFDDECSVFDFDNINHRRLTIEYVASELGLTSLYDIIGELEVTKYRYFSTEKPGRDSNDDYWLELEMEIKPSNRYFEKILKQVIPCGKCNDGIFKYSITYSCGYYHPTEYAPTANVSFKRTIESYRQMTIRDIRIKAMRLYDEGVALYESITK